MQEVNALKTVRKRKKRLCNIVCIVLSVFLLTACAMLIGSAFYVRSHFDFHLPEDFLRMAEKGESPRFFIYHFTDRVGRVGEKEDVTPSIFAKKTDTYVAYPDIPEDMIHAFVAIEDKHFFEHRGVDWKRTAAAVLNYASHGSFRFGASTVTQQLVKNMTGNKEVSAARKLQEMLYAADLERCMDKTEIMELYLNVIHFSDQCDGIAEAARHYFSKDVCELTAAECATIAAITNSPSYYNPIRHPEHNLERRNLILSQMHREGYLTDNELESALQAPIGLQVDREDVSETTPQSWYVDMVIEDVINDLVIQYGISRAMAAHAVYTGGIQIDMAMDPAVQSTAEEYYRTAVQLPKNQKGESAQSAVIILDSRTGDILAVVGAVGVKTGDRVQNFATQTLRPPGSTIKPISVYAPALEEGIINWASVYDDVPVTFGADGHTPWPHNATGVYRGLTDISYAIAHSTNTVSVRVLEELGKETAFRVAKERFHLSSLINKEALTDRDTAALALGQLNYGVTLREMTAAYGVFADRGIYHAPRSYYRVTDRDGTVLLSRPDQGETVISEANAAVMTKLLQGVIEHGTSTAVTLNRLVECAGKSGTTNADCDRWFVGYTPDLVCGVWCGYEYPEPLEGKNICTDIWNRIMRAVVSNHAGRTEFSVPENVISVTYCKDSGKLMTDACRYDPRASRAEIGWFVKGTEPTEFCDCHVLCEYDSVHGGICHGNCPEEERTQIALIRVDRAFPMQVLVSDAQYVWHGDPVEMPANTNENQAYFAATHKEYCGISPGNKPYNRSCSAHLCPTSEDWEELYKRFFESR